MPLLHIENPNSDIQLAFWHITEATSDLTLLLEAKTIYTAVDIYNITNHPKRIKELCAARILLAHLKGVNCQLVYNQSGKPFLNDNTYVSISHSNELCALAVSHKPIGFDIEKIQEKAVKLSSRFANSQEQDDLDCWLQNQDTSTLKSAAYYFTQLWTIKEAAYKLHDAVIASFGEQFMVDIREQSIRTRVNQELMHTNPYIIPHKAVECNEVLFTWSIVF